MKTSLSPLPVRVRHTADGIATSYSCAIELTDESILDVYLDGELQTSGYSYNAENQEVSFDIAPIEGVVINFLRRTPISYEKSITSLGIITTEILDKQATEMVARMQELDEKISRTPMLPIDTDRGPDQIFEDLEIMEANAAVSAEEAIQAAEEVKGLRDEAVNSLNGAVEAAKTNISTHTENMLDFMEEQAGLYVNEARVWATGETEEVNQLENGNGERSSRGYANVSAAFAETPEDVEIQDSDITGVTFIKGDKGDAGKDGAPGGGWELFDFKSSDHKIKHFGWVRSNAQWNYASAYPTAYEHLVNTSDEVAFSKKFYLVEKDSIPYLCEFTETEARERGRVTLYHYQETSATVPEVQEVVDLDETYLWVNGDVEFFTKDYKYSEITYTDKFFDGNNFFNERAIIKRNGEAAFGTSSILRIPHKIPSAASTNWSWEFVGHFITGSDITSNNVIFESNYLTNNYGLLFRISSSKLEIHFSSNGTSWDIASAVKGTTTLTTYTEYWVKMQRTYDEEAAKGKLVVYLSRDNLNWTTEITISSDLMLLNTLGTHTFIGNRLSDMTAQYFRGSIFINDCYFKALDPAMEAINWEPYNYTEVKYYRNSEERKICLPDQLDNLKRVRQLTGQAWYYMLDRSEERFKLPYSDNFIRWSNEEAGNYNEDMSRDFVIHAMAGDNVFSGYDKTFSRTENNLVFPEENRENKGNFAVGSYIADIDWESFVSRMSNKFNTGDQVAPRTNNFYLYFYLGEVKANEASVDVNGLTDALANKMDIDMGNTSLLDFDYVIESKLPTDEDPSWYRLYKSGWLEQGGKVVYTSAAGFITVPYLKDYLYIPSVQINLESVYNAAAYTQHDCAIKNVTAKGFDTYIDSNLPKKSWEARGMIYKGE